MRRSLPWLVAFAGSAVLLQAACASLTFDGAGGSPTPLPSGSPTPPPTPATVDVGDGGDGSLTAAGTVVVNTCVQLSQASATTAVVTSATPFHIGRRVLLLQVQGFASVVGNTAQIVEPSAGMFEIRDVAGFGIGSGSASLTLSSALATTYATSPTQRAEACTVPQFTDVTVPSATAISARAWNGTSGGIVAFFANGTVSVDGAIGAGAGGFRGAIPETGNCDSHDVTALETSSVDGAPKGESIDVAGGGKFGRGNYANGGGGGNSCNAGGGGGGNGGIGGYGGYETTAYPADPLTMGLPGAPIASSPAQRLLFGGGGGAGHENGSTGSAGGRGGGAILLSVRSLSGVGMIGAGGHSAVGSCSTDGCGGGGAGGTIVVLVAGGSTYTGVVSVAGGSGSTMGGVVGTNYGPGGGGGGGRIWLQGVSGAQLKLTGGFAGTTPSGSNFGATPGGAGVSVVLP